MFILHYYTNGKSVIANGTMLCNVITKISISTNISTGLICFIHSVYLVQCVRQNEKSLTVDIE